MVFITPINLASAIKNSLIFCDLSSLSNANFSVMLSNLDANSAVEVCAFHFTALFMY